MPFHERQSMKPKELVIHLTLQCPLRCAHCCVDATMSRSGHLDESAVLAAIDDAALIDGLERVSFAGGDPFLHVGIMEAAVRHATARGLRSGAVTSAYWATSSEKALAVLRPLVEAGLDRLTLSYDDAHAPFVSAQKIVDAYEAARTLNIEILISVAVEPGAKITVEWMRRLLSPLPEARVVFIESVINSTGRAAVEATTEQREGRRRHDGVYRGPCTSVFRQISLHEDGAVTPCCGVIPTRDRLRVGTIERDSIRSSTDRALRDPLFRWIAFEGPVEILKQITRGTATPMNDDDFDGICHACDVLFTSEENLRLLDEALPRKEFSLRVQETIFTAAGLFRPATMITEGKP